MTRTLRTLATAILALGAVGCHRAKAPAPVDGGARAAADLPPALAINDSRKDLIFSWQDDQGTFHDTSKASQVPEAFRKHVLVRDLSRTPKELHADEYMYVANLTQKDDDGGYAYAVVSRYHFRLPEVEAEADGGFTDAQIIVYGTSWCGACAEARRYFTAHHLTFVDKDIEKDPQAAAELARKAKRAGFVPNGVPVIDVRGHLLEGFSPAAVQAALNQG